MSAARLCLAAMVAAGACAILAGPAAAASGPSVKLYDDCEPASFNAAIAPGTCVGDGRTQFADFIASLIATKNEPDWRFEPGARTINAGQSLDVRNHGGEFHTFTDVTKTGFTPGCVDVLNVIVFGSPELGPACSQTVPGTGEPVIVASGVDPGERKSFRPAEAGTHLFQCLIHPWMRAEVRVRAD